jgi:anti-sigma B factor antagonist
MRRQSGGGLCGFRWPRRPPGLGRWSRWRQDLRPWIAIVLEMDGGHCEPTSALLTTAGRRSPAGSASPGARTLRGAISRQAWLSSRSINPKIEDLGVIRWDDMGVTLVVVMPEDSCPVQWTGRQAVVTLPQHIDGSNADQIREQLLWIINRGAAVLIVDLTETISCDYTGADALARVHDRAVADGTELRVAVMTDVVRRVLSLSGLDRLVAVYSDLHAAIAAAAQRREVHGAQGTGTADEVARAGELLDSVVHNMFILGLIVPAATDLPRGAAAHRITEALGRLDDVVREVRDQVLAARSQRIRPDSAWRPPPDVPERSASASSRSASLRQRLRQTAHALHVAAGDTAALLERHADLLGQPARIDCPAEVKRWRAFADQARQMAEPWEQPS